MARPLALLLAAVALIAFGAWLFGGGSARAPSAPTVIDPDAGTPDTRDTQAAGTPSSRSGPTATAPKVTRTDRPPRVALQRGRGTLRLIPVVSTVPVNAFPFVFGILAEDPDAEVGRLDMLAARPDGEVAPFELPEGSYRVFVVRGPGDDADAPRSAYWCIDQFDDVVHIAADDTTKHEARVVRSGDGAPSRGSATIHGIAWLDGRPAAGCLVSSDPVASVRSSRVAADGTFDLGSVPVGLQRLQLSNPVELVRRGEPVVRIADLDVAPREGESLQVRFDARTASVELTVVDPTGAPAKAARVAVFGVPTCVLPGIGPPVAFFERQTDSLGRVTVDGLPACSLRLEIDSTSHAAPDLTLEVIPGIAHPLRVELQGRVTVDGTVDVLSFGSTSKRIAGTIFFTGPLSRRAFIRPDGSFSTDELIPGRYETRVLTTLMRTEAGPSLDVGPAGLREQRIVSLRPRTGNR